MATSFDCERSRHFDIGYKFSHNYGSNHRQKCGRDFRSLEIPDDSLERRSPRREFKSRRLRPTVSRSHESSHVRRENCHGSVANQLERLHIADHQVPLLEQSPSLGSESNIDVSSRRTGVRHRNLNTFSEQAIKNNSLHGAAMIARDRLHERFKAASLLNNRMQRTSSIALRAENYAPSEEYASISGIDWEKEVRNWLASGSVEFDEILQREFSARNESEDENLESAQEDCPICLDLFLPGEQMIKLPCSHRFHIACLTPWLIIHRDCPYCRANVLGNH